MAKEKINQLGELLSTFFGKIEILDDKISFLTAPGEHYGSVMYAIDITTKTKSGKIEIHNLVAKVIPANKMLRIAFDISVTFRKEAFFYLETLPALVAFQKEYNFPSDQLLYNIFPKCYGARLSLDESKNEVDEDAIIIFENLKMQGYKTEDRLIGYDLESALIVLTDLGRFHAVPIALKKLKLDVFQEKVIPCFVQNKGLEQLPSEIGLAFHNSIMDGARKVDDLKPYLDKLQKIVDYASEHPFVFRPPPHKNYGTISHSDYWTSNTMLLRDSKGKPIANKMVDLQLISYSSVIRDLVFFMFTSIINDVLDENVDLFIKTYYDSFIDTLKLFKIDLESYSWELFNEELQQIAPTEVYHILVMLKPICTERGKVKHSLEEFEDSDWSRSDLLGPNHTRKIRDTVLSLAKKNWL